MADLHDVGGTPAVMKCAWLLAGCSAPSSAGFLAQYLRPYRKGEGGKGRYACMGKLLMGRSRLYRGRSRAEFSLTTSPIFRDPQPPISVEKNCKHCFSPKEKNIWWRPTPWTLPTLCYLSTLGLPWVPVAIYLAISGTFLLIFADYLMKRRNGIFSKMRWPIFPMRKRYFWVVPSRGSLGAS